MTYGGDPTYWDERKCSIPKCGATIPDNAPVAVCRTHGLQIARVYADVMASEDRDRRVIQLERRQADKGNREGLVVYYIRIGDYIKIGFTSRLKDRIHGLRVTRDDVLAIEPGGRELEAQRHEEFATERVHRRRENFFPSTGLLAHIESCRAEHPLPQWLTLPDTDTIRRGA